MNLINVIAPYRYLDMWVFDGPRVDPAELDAEGWLCPALLRYFDAPPSEIHVQVRARPEGVA